MPGNKNFPVDITANDKFSSVVDKFNKRMTEATRPIAQFGKATKELSEKSGLTHIAKGLTEIRAVAGEAGKELGVLSGPLGFLTGAGAIAGIAAMADRWAGVGRSLTNAAASSGVAASGLSQMQGAARLAGASGDAVTASMQNLAEATNDASLGRNNLALATLNQLGIHLARTKDGLVDTKKEFLDLLDAIAAQPNPQAQNLVARNLGIDPSLLTADVRKRGAAAWIEREEKAKTRGDSLTPGQIKDADELSQSIEQLKSSVSGRWNAVMADIGGSIKTVVDGVDKWIVNNGTAATRMIESSIPAAGVAGLFNAGGILSRPLVGLAGGIGAGALGGAAAGALTFDYFEDAKRINNQIRDLGGFVDESGQFHPIDTSATGDDAGKLIGIPSATGTLSSGPSPSGALPLGMRMNNPGNLQPGGREASFGSMHSGLEAAALQLIRDQDVHGLHTVADVIGDPVWGWAPASDPRNNTSAYISDISRKTNIGPHENVDFHDPAILQSVLEALTHHENGVDAAPHREMADAVADALSRKPMAIRIELAGAPAGTRVTASDSAGNAVPVRVEVRTPLSASP